MEALKATTAREIDKKAVTEGVNVAVHDRDGALLSQTQEGGMNAGDFYFRTNVVARYEKASWFRRVILRQREKLVTTYPTNVVISCPFCGLPERPVAFGRHPHACAYGGVGWRVSH
jgi:hypothetical protein